MVAEQNLDRLLGFFRQKELNELLTGYCEKVLYNLFAGRRTQVQRTVMLVLAEVLR